jgi:hypothetical protein
MMNNYPHEKLLFKLIEREEWYQLSDLVNHNYYIYLVAIVLVAVSGIVFQSYLWKTTSKNRNNDDEVPEITREPIISNEGIFVEGNSIIENKVNSTEDTNTFRYDN